MQIAHLINKLSIFYCRSLLSKRNFFTILGWHSDGLKIPNMENPNSEQVSGENISAASIGLNSQLSDDGKSLSYYKLDPAECPFMSGSVTLTNLSNDEKTKHSVEKLAGHTLYGLGCQNNQCHSAMMSKFNSPKMDPDRSKEQVLAEATEFLYEFYRECHPRGLDGLSERLNAVQQSIGDKGYYFHTPAELAYGVKLSWRNSSKCIMRSQWRNISVVDARGPDPEYGRQITNEEIFGKCVNHLRNAVTTDTGGTRVIKAPHDRISATSPGRTYWMSYME